MSATYSVDVCTDCVMAVAGYSPEELGQDRAPDREPMALWADERILWALPCASEECNEDAEPWFSWRDCQGCGSTLGGDRLTVTGVSL